ncbi:M48 family metalloprotease [Novosphingobium flavum]|uniref:M48 family metalloprotease n=1 Tax=Novosphingobium flavum TaxID=1778672 RepID=A0A7X1FPK6_9SPHN|nr:M48 family metalloprotease [Novosphingobium flavum]MBC2664608.1 M48 family metalloprotease [Novosphingobium flavum]
MRTPFRFLSRAAAVLIAAGLSINAAAAQSILRDAETEALFRDMASPLVKAAGLDPKNVDVALVGDRSINAFVMNGQTVYLNAGLIEVADTANQVQGVIAHELGHVTGGHAISGEQSAKEAGTISLLSLLLGAAAAVAGGGEAGMAAMMAGQSAAMGKYLSFSRAQEAQADAAGASFLSGAGITGKGSIEFFKKLEAEGYRRGYSQADQDVFLSTHPLEGDRIAVLQESYQKDPAWLRPSDPALEARFRRAKAKLYGYLAEPEDTLKAYPLTDNSVPARYARAYAFHKEAYLDKAMGEVDSLLREAPQDPYFLELKGQILLEAGKPVDALAPLREATELTGNQPLIATTFGHALVATEDAKNLAEAQRVLKAAVARDRENPDAWYQLGVVYAMNGDMVRARMASAEQQVMAGRWAEANASAQAAMAGLPKQSPDWLRAQDISYQASAQIERGKKRK